MEKWRAWSDCDGEVERRFTNDQLLTTVMLYWVTGTIGSSFRFHRDWALGAASLPGALAVALADRAEVPAGVTRPLGRGERIGVPAAVALFDYPCPGNGRNEPMATCAASPTCPAAAISRPWRNPSCWPTTSAASSGPCGDGNSVGRPARAD